MEPFIYGMDNYYGFSPLPVFPLLALFPLFFLSSDGPEGYFRSLNKSEQEAVLRMRDTFRSEKEMKRFVRGLRG